MSHPLEREVAALRERMAEVAEQARFDALLAESTVRLHRSLDLHVVLEAALHDVAEALRVDRALIRLVDDERPGTLLPGAVEHVAPGCPPWPHGAVLPPPTVAARALAGEAQYLRAPFAELPPEEALPTAASGAASLAVIPLGSEDGAVGLLVLAAVAGDRTWTPRERTFLAQFATPVAVAVMQARLVSRLKEEKASLEAIHELGKAIMGELKLEPMLHRALIEIGSATRRPAGVAYLFDEEAGELAPRAQLGLPPGTVMPRISLVDPGASIPGEWSLAERSAALGVVVSAGPADLPRDGWPLGFGVLSIPLVVGDRLKGVLQLGSKSDRPLARRDERTLGILGQQLAVAIENDQAFQALRELNQLKNDFIAVASHELRTPLTAIKGFAATLGNPQFRFTPEEVREYLGIIDVQADRLVRLLDEVLDVSRIESGRMRLQFRQTDPGPIVARVVATLAKKFPGREVDVLLPPGLALATDPDRLEQVLTNLVDNALKYSVPDSPVEVRAEVRGPEVRFAVRNVGPSLTEQERARLFQKFVRLERNSARTSGTGLGLYIARSLVEMLGGVIGVKEPAGGGVEFVFTVPVHHRTVHPPDAPVPPRGEAWPASG